MTYCVQCPQVWILLSWTLTALLSPHFQDYPVRRLEFATMSSTNPSMNTSSSMKRYGSKLHQKPTPEEAVERLSHYHAAHHHFHRAKSVMRRSGRIMIAGAGFLADSYGKIFSFTELKRM